MMFQFVLDLLENTTSYSSYDKELNRTIQQHRFNYDKSRLVMNSSGEIQFWRWEDNLKWNMMWWRPSDICDRHNYCGNFSSCRKDNWIPCKCLPGFRRLSDNGHGYQLGERFQGCVRKSQTPCLPKVMATANNDLIFINLTKIKVGNPDIGLPSE
ncbi:G-type lectin S-receptor-like serine/threonine-protein kinase, partial [Trifolium medium]|nr:G-type lectin S-receptor-like serine/threonine-protein kinase [Trifolium medium]